MKAPKLTLKTAKELAGKIIGTSKGLAKSMCFVPWMPQYQMEQGETLLIICWDTGASAISATIRFDMQSKTSFYNADTLAYDDALTEKYNEELRQKAFDNHIQLMGNKERSRLIEALTELQKAEGF